MKSKLNEKDKILLVRHYEAGESVSKICKENNIPRSSFYYWVKKYNYKNNIQINSKLNQRIEKLNLKLEVLAKVNCTKDSPLKDRLYELEKLYGQYNVTILCEALNVSRGTFYNHVLRNKKADTSYVRRKEEVTKHVVSLFHETNEILGAKKISFILKSRGIIASQKYVSTIMKEQGLRSIRIHAKKDFNQLTKKQDLLSCNFKAERVNQIWVSDTSYIPYKEKFYYICVVLDLYSRKVISYKISEKHTTNLVTATFKKAFSERNKPTNLIFHSDRGTQFTSNTFRTLLKTLNVTQSFSIKGKPTHNAVMEAFFANLKKEEIYRNNYTSLAHLKASVNEYIEFYNNIRPHHFLKFRTPNEVDCTNSSVQNS